jgi:hypothetical protein
MISVTISVWLAKTLPVSQNEPKWPSGVDAAERVRHVVLTQTEPQNAGWIATEADVSRDTAVKYLNRMVEHGDLEVTETADGTCYKPDAVTQFLQEVRRLAEEQTLEGLTKELNAIGEEIDGWKERFEVDSLTELRQSIGSEEVNAEDRRERLATIEEWEYNKEVRELIQFAISLKSSLSTLNTDSLPSDSSTTLPQEG